MNPGDPDRRDPAEGGSSDPVETAMPVDTQAVEPPPVTIASAGLPAGPRRVGGRLAAVVGIIAVLAIGGVAFAGYFLAAGAPDDRRVVAGLACLTLLEVTVISALATLFSSFSSPFLTAVFTFSVVVVGRSADSLAKLPTRVFGETIHDVGAFLSRIVPNLMLFVPPRPLLTGEASGADLSSYLLLAGAHAVGWAVLLVAVASLVFHRRDFL